MTLLVAALAGAQACDGEDLTVGDQGSEVERPLIEAGDVWTGYIERFQFPSGSDRIGVEFTSPTTHFDLRFDLDGRTADGSTELGSLRLEKRAP